MVSTGNANGKRQGFGTLSDDHWHHLLLSYPGNGADLNTTRIYLDGNLADVPASSVSGLVNTSPSSGVKIGANFDHSNSMTGLLDEVRISNQNRGQAWAKYSFLNQEVVQAY